MSAVAQLANPHRIKRSHRRRWKCSTGHRVYANNNPVRFTDPFGLYACDGDQCEHVKESMEQLREARDNSSGEMQQRLTQLVEFYGTEGDGNGVNIGFGQVPGYGATSTDPKSGDVSITINDKLIAVDANERGNSFSSAFTAILAHEGAHGVHQRLYGMPRSGMAERSLERDGAWAEAYGWAATGESSWWHTWTPAGGVNQGWINKEAEAATRIWCAQRGGTSGC